MTTSGRIARGVVMAAGVGVALLATAAQPAAAAAPAAGKAAPAPTCGPSCSAFVAPTAVSTGAADATAPINTALASLPAGWTLQLGAGTYRVAKPIVLPAMVTLTGVGMDSTRLLLDRRNWSNFGYSFVVVPGAAGAGGATVRNLTVDGNRVAVDSVGASTTPTANAGGGIKLGNSWTVTGVRLSNLNYFKLWAKDITGGTISNCQFADLGTGVSGGNDNIGGGNAKSLKITGNTFTARSIGNSIDLLRSANLTISGNVITGTASNPHNMYLEGVTDSIVSGNTLTASSISVQSNGNYASATEVVNPRNVTVTGNTITDPAVQGISLRYDATRGTATTGGANAITNNTITRPGTVGVVVMAAANGLVTSGDQISTNTVTDPFARGGSSWNCGYGVTAASGIVVAVAAGSDVSGNKVTDTRATSTTKAAVQFGISSGRAVTVKTSTTTPNVGVRTAVVELRV